MHSRNPASGPPFPSHASLRLFARKVKSVLLVYLRFAFIASIPAPQVNWWTLLAPATLHPEPGRPGPIWTDETRTIAARKAKSHDRSRGACAGREMVGGGRPAATAKTRGGLPGLAPPQLRVRPEHETRRAISEDDRVGPGRQGDGAEGDVGRADRHRTPVERRRPAGVEGVGEQRGKPDRSIRSAITTRSGRSSTIRAVPATDFSVAAAWAGSGPPRSIAPVVAGPSFSSAATASAGPSAVDRPAHQTGTREHAGIAVDEARTHRRVRAESSCLRFRPVTTWLTLSTSNRPSLMRVRSSRATAAEIIGVSPLAEDRPQAARQAPVEPVPRRPGNRSARTRSPARPPTCPAIPNTRMNPGSALSASARRRRRQSSSRERPWAHPGRAPPAGRPEQSDRQATRRGDAFARETQPPRPSRRARSPGRGGSRRGSPPRRTRWPSHW